MASALDASFATVFPENCHESHPLGGNLGSGSVRRSGWSPFFHPHHEVGGVHGSAEGEVCVGAGLQRVQLARVGWDGGFVVL